jgi:hypothetical protein
MAALALVVAGGCVTPPPEPEAEAKPADVVDAARVEEPQPPPEPLPPAVAAPRVDETSAALSYFERVRRMPAGELARELETNRAAYGRTQADTERMRVAMLLALPGTPVTDDARALELLDPIVKNSAHALHPLAVLLSTYVQEQRRLMQSTQALQKDVHTLQQKLDALRSLERALSEREGALPRRR